MLFMHLLGLCAALAVASFSNNVAVYWGQNLAAYSKTAQKHKLKYIRGPTLEEVCADKNVDIVIISFMDEIPYSGKQRRVMIPNIDLYFGTYSYKHNREMRYMEQQIQRCQQEFKTKVFVSVGGEAGSYNFKNSREAQDFAKVLAYMFANTSSDDIHSKIAKPFGNVVIDGIDLDIECADSSFLEEFAVALKASFKTSPFVNKFHLSGSPECVYPSEYMAGLLNKREVQFDILFVQFYNNAQCEVHSAGFNWNSWVEYAAAREHDIQLYLGLPGSSDILAAESGYVSDLNLLQATLAQVAQTSNGSFGGVSLWEASLAYSNTDIGANYIAAVKRALNTATNSELEEGEEEDQEQEQEHEQEEEQEYSSGASMDGVFPCAYSWLALWLALWSAFFLLNT